MVPSTRNFAVTDPVWIKISDTLPWKKGTIVSVRDHESYDVQVDDKVYRRNTHHLARRYPRVDENLVKSDREDDPIGDTPQRTLRPRQS